VVGGLTMKLGEVLRIADLSTVFMVTLEQLRWVSPEMAWFLESQTNDLRI
jgi:hypothetical protein